MAQPRDSRSGNLTEQVLLEALLMFPIVIKGFTSVNTPKHQTVHMQCRKGRAALRV